MKRFIPIILVALMGIFTVSCNGGDDDNDPVVIGDAPAFSATEIPAGSSILIENSPTSSALTLETDGNFELEIIDGNYYLKANTMGEAEVTVTNNEGISVTDTISSWGVLLDESGVDYQGIIYAGDTISNNGYSSSSAVSGDIIIPRYIEQDGAQTDLSYVPALAFLGNDSITSLSCAEGSKLVSFGEGSVAGTGLVTVDLSNCAELEYIKDNAFGTLGDLLSVDLSNCSKLKFIGEWAFGESVEMQTVDFSGCTSLEYIGERAFWANYLKTVDLSDCTKLEFIADECFTSCDDLEALVISSEEAAFGDDVFDRDAVYNIYGVLGSNTESNALAKGYNFTDINDWN